MSELPNAKKKKKQREISLQSTFFNTVNTIRGKYPRNYKAENRSFLKTWHLSKLSFFQSDPQLIHLATPQFSCLCRWFFSQHHSWRLILCEENWHPSLSRKEFWRRRNKCHISWICFRNIYWMLTICQILVRWKITREVVILPTWGF